MFLATDPAISNRSYYKEASPPKKRQFQDRECTANSEHPYFHQIYELCSVDFLFRLTNVMEKIMGIVSKSIPSSVF